MEGKDQIQSIIIAYLSGKATEEDVHILEEYVKQSPENNQYFQEMRNIWQVVHPAFEPSEIRVVEVEEKISKRLSRVKRSLFRTGVLYWQRAAAILIIPLFVACLYMWNQEKEEEEFVSVLSEYQEIRSPHGTFSEIGLPDGSRVWLNGGSVLKYPLKFQTGSRDVYLKGEGYFEVQADVLNPFIVRTDQIELQATGTAFNIEAYAGDTLTAVTMASGKVSVAFGNTSPVVMVPGERASFNSQTKQCQIVKSDSYKWCAWKDGLMIFRDDPLSYVFKRISQTFNVNIVLKDSSIGDAPYRATFEYESLNEILRLLEMSAPLSFKQSKREKGEDNTFEKQTIVVSKRGV